MSQKIPPGYAVMRLRGQEIFTFIRGDGTTAGQAWAHKQDCVDALWRDFRDKATTLAASIGTDAVYDMVVDDDNDLGPQRETFFSAARH
jgi:hypothetical protein